MEYEVVTSVDDMERIPNDPFCGQLSFVWILVAQWGLGTLGDGPSTWEVLALTHIVACWHLYWSMLPFEDGHKSHAFEDLILVDWLMTCIWRPYFVMDAKWWHDKHITS